MEIVLVHGGLHGAWCWDHVAPFLAEAGLAVSAPDLPGMGEDRTPLNEVTLASTADFLAHHVRQRRDVILVGHSMAGPAISECAERAPDHLLGLVYLAANLVPSGQSMRDAAATNLEGVMSGVRLSADGISSTYDAKAALGRFYNTTDRAEAERAIDRLTPQPLEPTVAPLSLTDGRFGSVARAYIECLQDRAIPIAFQRQMRQVLPCEIVVTMDCDHSPFLCQPQRLAEHLMRVAQDFQRRRAGSGRSEAR